MAIASPAGRFLQWKAVLHPGGVLGGVGVNYLPVNAAPVVDELVVVPGARLNPQNQPDPQQQTVNINFPSANQGPTMTFRRRHRAIPSRPSRTRPAITVRWAAHDDNGDDLTILALPPGRRRTRLASAEGQHHREGLQLRRQPAFPTAATRSRWWLPIRPRTLPAKRSPAPRRASASKSTPRRRWSAI